MTLNLYSAVRDGKLEQDFYEYSNQGNTITKDYLVDLAEKRSKLFFGDTGINNFDTLLYDFISFFEKIAVTPQFIEDE